MVSLYRGQKFASYKAFKKHFKAYQAYHKQCFSRVRSTRSTAKQLRKRNIDTEKFPYYYLEYHCYFGPNLKGCKSTGKRKSK